MIDLDKKVSPHFRLGELVPDNCKEVPPQVMGNLERLCSELLEPIRQECGAVIVTSGYRPPAYNASIGGARTSDHVYGRAADFYVVGQGDVTWEYMTEAAFQWAVKNLAGKYGQVILEDHRQHYASKGKLWVHISIPSDKHPGTGDRNSTLVSLGPGRYEPYGGSGA